MGSDGWVCKRPVTLTDCMTDCLTEDWAPDSHIGESDSGDLLLVHHRVV